MCAHWDRSELRSQPWDPVRKMDQQGIAPLLWQLMSADNTARSTSEAQYTGLLQSSPASLAMELLKVVATLRGAEERPLRWVCKSRHVKSPHNGPPILTTLPLACTGQSLLSWSAASWTLEAAHGHRWHLMLRHRCARPCRSVSWQRPTRSCCGRSATRLARRLGTGKASSRPS